MYARAARLFAISILAGVGFGGSALAAEHGTLSEFLFGSHPQAALQAGRYEVSEGRATFVLDTAAGKSAFLKFEGSPEIWALHPTSGPRGDVIYKNDMDEPMLRATRLGGITLFTQDQPEGLPAAFIGLGPPPRIVHDMELDELFNIFVQASSRTSHAAQHLIVFEGPQDITPSTAPVFADAAIVTSQAFARVAGQGKFGKVLVARFARVEFSAGRGASAATRGQTVSITVAPDQGIAGRPSSERIAEVISRK
jgi:hypothetical protein